MIWFTVYLLVIYNNVVWYITNYNYSCTMCSSGFRHNLGWSKRLSIQYSMDTWKVVQICSPLLQPGLFILGLHQGSLDSNLGSWRDWTKGMTDLKLYEVKTSSLNYSKSGRAIETYYPPVPVKLGWILKQVEVGYMMFCFYKMEHALFSATPALGMLSAGCLTSIEHRSRHATTSLPVTW